MSNIEKAVVVADHLETEVMTANSYSSPPNPHEYVRALDAEGLLMPDLPEPEIGAVSGVPRWYVHNWSISREPNDDTASNYVFLDHEPRMTKPYVFTPQDARLFALSILAAADHEETEE